MKTPLIIVGLLFALQASAQDYTGEEGYAQFIKCNEWAEKNTCHRHRIATQEKEIALIRMTIIKMDAQGNEFLDQMQTHSVAMHDHAADGNTLGHKDAEARYKDAEYNMTENRKIRQFLVEEYEAAQGVLAELVAAGKEMYASGEDECTGKTFSPEIVRRACRDYDANTITYCQVFREK